jgi:DNA segregation ATPase FtsK/SpoIIIE, S-DNA-T family
MNKYKEMTEAQVDELLSNYLINSWSYSKVRTFAGNEKAFEMQYIYNCYGKSSATTIAGQAYHAALNLYFLNLKSGELTDIVTMQNNAYAYIDNVRADWWKLQKTTPTVEECKIKAIETVTKLLNNFMSRVHLYLDEISEVIDSELSITSWLTVNGVDIPLPCHLVIDLIIKTREGKLVLIDHKSKVAFTDENEIKFTSGKQAIIYTLGYEEKTGQSVDEVWFIENKSSKNKDGSPQLVKHITVMNEDTRRLYEALLYEPLKRLVEAVGNPDYVYMINDNDNLSDKAEIYDFWAKTMIAEVEDFDIPENKKPLIRERMRKIRDASLASITPTTIKNFKTFTEEFIPYDFSNKNMTNQEKIEHILRSFGIVAKVQHTFNGYSSASYLLEINAGVQISSIQRYKLDIANALNVSNVRIHKDLFVYEGKSYLAIESGTKSTSTLVWDSSKLIEYKLPVGVDNFQQVVFWDLDNQSTPHILVCGATGSGKSVFLRSTIEYALLSGVNEVYIFDPKHEFKGYLSRPGVKVVCDIEEIELQIMMLVEEMERRVKNNISIKTLVVFDEFADAVANSRKGNELKNYGEEIIGAYASGAPKIKRVVKSIDKSLEENLKVLLQKGRSCGFRIMSATQRASTKVITGDAKVNLPVQVCFRVPKDIDSMVVIDEPGAEALNGRGDGLIKSPEYMNVIRFQGFYKE